MYLLLQRKADCVGTGEQQGLGSPRRRRPRGDAASWPRAKIRDGCGARQTSGLSEGGEGGMRMNGDKGQRGRVGRGGVVVPVASSKN